MDRGGDQESTQQKETPIGAPLSASEDALDSAIRRAQEYLLGIQYSDGYWWGKLESNVTMAAEYLLMTHFLGVADSERWRKIANYLKQQQLPDGTWNIYYGGPGDLNATTESYFALKLAGEPADTPPMVKARRFILSKGGVPSTRVFTRFWLALFGQYPWNSLPAMPPEVMFLPNWSPFNIYEFSSWARATIVPLLILLTHKPTCPLPEYAQLDELFPGGRRPRYPLLRPGTKLTPWRLFFLAVDQALRWYERIPEKPWRSHAVRAAERWIVEHQEADGSWGGIQPPWVYSLMALKVLGYPLDHPVIARGLRGLETTFAVERDDVWYHQACLSPVWDTALAMIGLLDSGLPPDHPALVQASEWLLREQIFSGGDWQVKNRHGQPGGWAFEFDNDIYPDVDDSAEVMIALHRTRLPDEEAKRRAIDRGLRWVLSMQCRNGGWGAFDVDNDKYVMTQIPFCDFGETLDPPTEDVTAHTVELLGLLGYKQDFRPLRRALEYLRRTQEPDGSWWGRWGVNYIYGIGAVLPALAAVGEDMSQEYVQRAVRWLEAHQNPDGGWGETCASYADPSLRGQGPSTASQTAWALMALLAAGCGNSDAVRRGVGYLVRTQTSEGTWDEPYFTGTGFPRDFFINYHLYRHYFPLMALGRYRTWLEAR